MSSQKLYIIRTQCMRVIIIFFGTPLPHSWSKYYPVHLRQSCSQLLLPTNILQRSQISIGIHFTQVKPLLPMEGSLPLPPPVRAREHPPASTLPLATWTKLSSHPPKRNCHLQKKSQNLSCFPPKCAPCFSPKIRAESPSWLQLDSRHICKVWSSGFLWGGFEPQPWHHMGG